MTPPSSQEPVRLMLATIEFDAAADFVREHHRHHTPPVGHKFSLAAWRGDVLEGVAIIGRPVARRRDDGLTLEVTRLCVREDAPRDAEVQAFARHRAATEARLTGVQAGEVLFDLERPAFGALHRLQHDGVPLAKSKLGGSLIQWAADEIAALRAVVARLSKPTLFWIDEDPENGYVDPWEATEAALYDSDDEGVAAIRSGREIGTRYYARLRPDDEIGIDEDWLRDFDTAAEAETAIAAERARRAALHQEGER